jgi:hypothetical protein
MTGPHEPEVGGWIASAPSRLCARDPCRSGSGGLPLRLSLRGTAVAGAALLLAACAATQAPDAVAHDSDTPGFLLGLWHGFIFPVAWIVSLFADKVAIYAVPNNGGWYDFGYFLGIVVFGVGARKSTTVYRDRVIYRDRAIEARKIN